LILTALVGSIPLLAWNSLLTYIWLPLLPFVLPVFALALARVGSRVRWLPAVIVVATALLCAPSAYSAAQFQFKMDSLFGELCDRIVLLPQKLGHGTSVILPLHHQASFELGEELESATLDRLSNGSAERNRLKFSNMTRYNWQTSEPGLDKCSYVSGPNPSWVEQRVAVGDVVAIPYGDIDGRLRDYRGGDLFWRGWQTIATLTPQLKLKPIFQIDRTITPVFGKPMTFGWIVLEVTTSPAISFSKLDPGGILENNCKIEVGDDLKKKTLVLTVAKLSKSPLQVVPPERPPYQILMPKIDQHSEGNTNLEILLPEQSDFILRSTDGSNPLFELKSLRFR
jgi:hypothetical protein